MDGSMIAGSCLKAREASAAMALVTAATEPECEIIAFSAPVGGGYGGMHGGGESGITGVNLSPRMRLDQVIQQIKAIPMGGTDCALPMLWAARNIKGRPATVCVLLGGLKPGAPEGMDAAIKLLRELGRRQSQRLCPLSGRFAVSSSSPTATFTSPKPDSF
jgi:hypothetical protein